MKKEKKSYQRTIRMTETTRAILENNSGNGINEKFENLVYESNIKLSTVQKEIDELEIKKKKLEQNICTYTDLSSDINYLTHDVNNLISDIKNMLQQVNSLNNTVERIKKE